MVESLWALSRRSFWQLAASTAITILASVALGVSLVSYEAQRDFAARVAVRNVQMFPEEAVEVRARPLWVSVGGRSVTVLLAEPTTDNAEVPFGLGTWPKPGTFLTSADLASHSGDLGARFGRFQGTLPDSYLPSAHARIVLVRPVEHLSDRWSASGFGVSNGNQLDAIHASGFFLDQRLGPATALSGIGLACLAPSLVLLAIVYRIVGRRYERRSRTLETLGVPPRTLHTGLLRAGRPARLLGIAVTATILAIAFVIDVPIPFADFTTRALDFRRHPWPLIGSWLLGVLVSAFFALVLTRPGRLAEANKPRAVSPPRSRTELSVLGLLAVLGCAQMAVWQTRIAASTGQDHGAILWIIGGSGLALLLSASMGRALIALLGRGIAALGRARRSALALLLGRSLAASPQPGRVVAAGAALIIITGLASTWSLMGALPAVQAQRVIDQVAGRFVSIVPPSDVASDPPDVLRGLPASIGTLTVLDRISVSSDGSATFGTSVYGSPRAIRHWSLTAGATQKAEDLPGMLGVAIPAGGEANVQVVEGEPPVEKDDTVHISYVAFRYDRERVDVSDVQRDVSAVGGPEWTVAVGGEHWIVGANDLAYQLRWTGWFAVVGGAILIGSIWSATLADQRRQISSALPIESLYGRRLILPRLLALRATCIGGAIVLLGGGIGRSFSRVTDGDLTTTGGSSPVIAAVSLAALATLTVLTLPQIRSLARAGRAWRPGDTNA